MQEQLKWCRKCLAVMLTAACASVMAVGEAETADESALQQQTQTVLQSAQQAVGPDELELIRTEQNLQLSGAVDDKLALSIGKFFGAQTIVSGRLIQFVI